MSERYSRIDRVAAVYDPTEYDHTVARIKRRISSEIWSNDSIRLDAVGQALKHYVDAHPEHREQIMHGLFNDGVTVSSILERAQRMADTRRRDHGILREAEIEQCIRAAFRLKGGGTNGRE